MQDRRAALCAIVLLAGYGIASVRYAAVWQNELTLWMWAADVAPNKPRPHTELALALIERRRYDEAAIVLDDEDRILRTCPLSPWDRSETTAALRQNRALVARLAASAAWPPRLGSSR